MHQSLWKMKVMTLMLKSRTNNQKMEKIRHKKMITKRQMTRRKLRHRRKDHLLHSQLLTRLRFYWHVRMETKMDLLSALTAVANAILTTERRKTWSISKLVSQRISLRLATTRFFFNKASQGVAHTYIFVIKWSHAVSATSTKYPSMLSKWTNHRSRRWRDSIAIFRLAL